MTTTPKDPQAMNEQLAKETCMCGDPIQDHGIGEGGHAPVSQYDHYKAQTTPGEGETNSALMCPFCGNAPYLSEDYLGVPTAHCEKFDCPGSDVMASLEAWNRRALSPARHPQELVEALKFYANTGNYTAKGVPMTPYLNGRPNPKHPAKDEGRIAREALSTYASQSRKIK